MGRPGPLWWADPLVAATRLVVVLVALHARPLASQCSFDSTIDPDKQMMGLVQDYNAYSLEVCKDNCCSDPSCTAYQFQQGFHGQMSCMRGADSKDLMDSGGMPWQGESGRGGGDDGKGKGGSSLDEDDWEDSRRATFALAGLFSVYMLLGTMHGRTQGKQGEAALPHPHFWRQLRGLVIDGWQFFFYDRKAGYVPTPLADGGDGDGAPVSKQQSYGAQSTAYGSYPTAGSESRVDGPPGKLYTQQQQQQQQGSALQIQGGQGQRQGGMGVIHGGGGGHPSSKTGRGRGGGGGRGGRGGSGSTTATAAEAQLALSQASRSGDTPALSPVGGGADTFATRSSSRQKLRKKKGSTSAASRLPVKPHVLDQE